MNLYTSLDNLISLTKYTFQKATALKGCCHEKKGFPLMEKSKQL